MSIYEVKVPLGYVQGYLTRGYTVYTVEAPSKEYALDYAKMHKEFRAVAVTDFQITDYGPEQWDEAEVEKKVRPLVDMRMLR